MITFPRLNKIKPLIIFILAVNILILKIINQVEITEKISKIQLILLNKIFFQLNKDVYQRKNVKKLENP